VPDGDSLDADPGIRRQRRVERRLRRRLGVAHRRRVPLGVVPRDLNGPADTRAGSYRHGAVLGEADGPAVSAPEHPVVYRRPRVERRVGRVLVERRIDGDRLVVTAFEPAERTAVGPVLGPPPVGPGGRAVVREVVVPVGVVVVPDGPLARRRNAGQSERGHAATDPAAGLAVDEDDALPLAPVVEKQLALVVVLILSGALRAVQTCVEAVLVERPHRLGAVAEGTHLDAVAPLCDSVCIHVRWYVPLLNGGRADPADLSGRAGRRKYGQRTADSDGCEDDRYEPFPRLTVSPHLGYRSLSTSSVVNTRGK